MTYHLLRFFFKLMSRLPFSVLYVMSGGIYVLLYHVARYRRKIVRKNLTECFPEKDLPDAFHQCGGGQLRAPERTVGGPLPRPLRQLGMDFLYASPS